MNNMLEITSIRNPLVKEIKSLYRKKGRIKNNSFIIEGMKAIEEAIDNNYPIKNIIYTDQILKIKDGEAFFERIKKTE